MSAWTEAMGWGAGVLAFLLACGFFIAGMTLLCAILVWGFTRNQRRLTEKGSELAQSVGEVQQLIDHDAAAFRRVFPVFFSWRLATGTPGESASTPRVPAIVGQPPVATRASRPAAATPVEPHPPAATAGLSPQGAKRDAEPVKFWQLLTPAERQGLKDVATDRMFLTGAELCRQGAPADRVFLIKSGWTKVCVQTSRGERILARRGPGDLVGERAAIRGGDRERSASVVAEEIVHTLVLTTDDFIAFVQRHPRVLDVLEGQFYRRLTEASGHHASRPPSWTGQYCSIVLLDVAAFGAANRRDDDRLTIRRVMYQTLHSAMETSGVSWTECHRDDRGDGVLVIVPPATPTATVVDALLTHLVAGLGRHNDHATDATRFQLRVALDVGPVVSDPEGVSGQAIIHAARILDAPPLKRQLAHTAADLGFIVSTHVYTNVITHHPAPVGRVGYQRVSFQGKESRITAWMRLIGRGADSASIGSL